ncbi:MAG: MoaD/ThiS family protein [Pseudomonadota bacterium]
MPKITFTQQLSRFTEVPEVEAGAGSLRELMEAAFAVNPRLRDYVLDEQGHLRKHVTVFVDGLRVREHVRLDQALSAGSKVYVLQALSGG